ncbi:hypothetical protein BDZ91DRAFT_257863 [Kalaharituber pfeilii]|nr:hypothetical protein BDZ91DRAFT_257863 [Kalaharituber pfeilii]
MEYLRYGKRVLKSLWDDKASTSSARQDQSPKEKKESRRRKTRFSKPKSNKAGDGSAEPDRNQGLKPNSRVNTSAVQYPNQQDATVVLSFETQAERPFSAGQKTSDREIEQESKQAPAEEKRTVNEEELTRANETIRNLLAEIQSLQASINQRPLISANACDAPPPLADDYIPDGRRDDLYFANKFKDLRTGIREWVAATFFKRGVDPVTGFSKLSQDVRQDIWSKIFNGMSNVRIPPEDLDAKMVRCFIQAYIAAKLNEFTFNTYLPGCEVAGSIPKLMDEMKGRQLTDIYSWKQSTLKLIMDKEKYTQSIEQKVQSITSDLVKALEPLHHLTVSATSSAAIFKPRRSARNLSAVFKSAAELVLELRNEPFTFLTEVCIPGELCCSSKWPVSDADGKVPDEELQQGQQRICFTLFPHLIREGCGEVQTVILVKAAIVVANPSWLAGIENGLHQADK